MVKYGDEEVSEDLLNRTGCDKKVQRGCDWKVLKKNFNDAIEKDKIEMAYKCLER